MGACCNTGEIPAIEFDDIKSIKDMKTYIVKKKRLYNDEIRQIKEHLNDPSKDVEYIDIEGVEPDMLVKRLGYLYDMINTYEKCSSILKEDKFMNIEELKAKFSLLEEKYANLYDPNDELGAAYKEFENYLKNN